MSKKMNQQFFAVPTSDNKQIIFFCYTTKTKLGFCHTVQSLNNNLYSKMITDTKTSYLNRTWESFDYETTIKKACKKIGPDIYKLAFEEKKLSRTF